MIANKRVFKYSISSFYISKNFPIFYISFQPSDTFKTKSLTFKGFTIKKKKKRLAQGIMELIIS